MLRYLDAAGNPVRSSDVVRAAEEAGYSRRTVYRARRTLEGLVADLGKSARAPQKRWVLSEDGRRAAMGCG